MTVTPSTFATTYPDHFYVDETQPEALQAHLESMGFLDPNERIHQCAKAGEGNMNCTLRVTTTQRSFIVKQARPWVEKYPQFEAPWDRILGESDFYQRTAFDPRIATLMPKLLATDDAHHLMLLQDLGSGSDYSSVYQGAPWDNDTLRSLASFLAALHQLPAQAPFPNRAMRELNHAHIFTLPLQNNNGLDLDAVQPGLAAIAEPLMQDEAYRQAVAYLGNTVYLADGPSLLHGDFYPGSILKTPSGPRVIDPEFAFMGRPEIDVAVFVAHLHLAQQADRIDTFLQHYQSPQGYDYQLQAQLAGIEIMRRLLGYAQLPLTLTLTEKHDLLERSRQWVLS